MGGIRDFSIQEGHVPPARNVEDAPQPMRQELIDVFFALAEQNPGAIREERIHRVICQSLGVGASANPYGGYRYAAGRDIRGVDWPRVYDLMCRLWPEYEHAAFHGVYREQVNRILAAYGAAWDLGGDGRLHRVLPAAAQAQVQAAIHELRDARFAAALALFNAASDAYDDRPRRDRDACMNVFQAVESVAQIKFDTPGRPFDGVIGELRRRETINPQVLDVLDSLNVLRHRNFGHGGAGESALRPAEVDFVYLTSIAAILLFTRTP